MSKETILSKRGQGDAAEEMALHYLQRHGLRLIERNFHCKLGELDLIMRDSTHLVFVEVRSRRSMRFGRPVETVAHRKQQRLLRSAAFYLQKHRLDLPCRFDIVGISPHSDSVQADSVQVEWIKDAFQAF